jgi:diacylglycerol kinase family enzyme
LVSAVPGDGVVVDAPFGPMTVIVDPLAGEGRVRGELVAVRRALEERGLPFTMSVAEGPGHVASLAARASEAGAFLVVVGDDATIQEAINGMFRDGGPIASEPVIGPVLGVIPANSGGDLVRSFGLPGDVDVATTHLLGTNTYPLDLMKVQYTTPGGERAVRYAHNVAEVGFHAAATATAVGLPRALRGARRFVGFWSALARSPARPLTVAADTREHQLTAWSVIVGNGQFADEGLRLSPRSYPGDGVLDALVFTGPRSDAYRMLPRVFRNGEHVPDPNIKELRARIRVAIDADRPMPLVLDGVPVGTTPATFQVVPQRLRLKL